MKKAILVSVILVGMVTLIAASLGWNSLLAGLWIGVFWGLANILCLKGMVQAMLRGQSRRQWMKWLLIKFLGLYGLIPVLLVWFRISALGWLIGFTLGLIAFAVAEFPSLKLLFTEPKVKFVVTLVVSLLGMSLLLVSPVLALEAVHGEAAAAPAHPPEIPNLITLLTYGSHGPVTQFLHAWENSIFALVIVFLVGAVLILGTRALRLIPGRGQIALEAMVQGVDDLVCGVLGKQEGRRYLPFLGTLFIFILSMNLAGLVPGLKSPTSRFEMTGALGLCVFFHVQSIGVRRLGIKGYLDHLLGQPRDGVGWILSPLMLFIHGIGELVKPLSLSLRLFGNVMGEDTLLGVFVTLGALTFAWSHLPIGIPLHLPFVLLAIIFSVVQALVFTMLSMIYIFMMLPHEEHQEESESPHGV